MRAKVGDIAIFHVSQGRWEENTHQFVRISRIDTEEKVIKIKLPKKSFWDKQEYKEETKTVITRVWWSIIGDISEQIHSKGYGTENYDWDRRCLDASYLLKQAKIILT